MKETGVNGVIIAEPAAGLVSNEDCSSFSSTYISRIVEELQDDNFMIVLHNCGNTGHCTAAMVETKAAGLHFGNKIDMVQVLQECPEDILVMGNIDPVGIFKMATPEKVKKKHLNCYRRQEMEEFHIIIRLRCSARSANGEYRCLLPSLERI